MAEKKKIAATQKKRVRKQKPYRPLVVKIEYNMWGGGYAEEYFTGWGRDLWDGKYPEFSRRWYEAKEYTMESAAKKAAEFIRNSGLDRANGWTNFKVKVQKAFMKGL